MSNSCIHVYLQLSLPVSVNFPLQGNACLTTTRCCYTSEAEKSETPFFKGDQVVGEVMNGEEKAEVEKKQDLKEGRKENIRENNFREYAHLKL